MRPRSITPADLETAAAVAEWTREHGYPPGLRELAAALGVNRSAAYQRTHRAAQHGLLRAIPYDAKRTIVARACGCASRGALVLLVAGPDARGAHPRRSAAVVPHGLCHVCGGVVLASSTALVPVG